MQIGRSSCAVLIALREKFQQREQLINGWMDRLTDELRDRRTDQPNHLHSCTVALTLLKCCLFPSFFFKSDYPVY